MKMKLVFTTVSAMSSCVV